MLTQDIQNIALDFLENTRQRIIDNQVREGVRASGKSARSLRPIPVGQYSAELRGAAYFQQQEEGRAPGKFPPINEIYDWLAYRKYGITYDDDKQRRSIAYLIARKIAQEGTHTYRTRQNKNIIGEAIRSRQGILRELAGIVGREVKQTVINGYGS